jgi:serine phosphatase RsbU (regulator of sigma subunit)
VLADLLDSAHLMAPADLAGTIAAQGRSLGIYGVQLYLTDLQQGSLYPLPGDSTGAVPALAIDSTLAGIAFQTITVLHAQHTGGPVTGTGAGGRAADAGLFQVWVPLLDGADRLGVVGFIVDDTSDATVARCRALASLAGLIVASKKAYSDTYAQVRRSSAVVLQAEMARAFMPPNTFATERVLVSAVLEPAYEVGGDAFDYGLLGDQMHVSVFDAVGHDLNAGLIASVAIASCRNTRRSGGDLTDIAAHADEAIARQFGSPRFATALLCNLDITSGEFSWVPCGHPPPLLIRGNKVIKELVQEPWLPLGIAGYLGSTGISDGGAPPAYTENLEPGDRVLLYTDGVTEGRDDDGSLFGLQRLSDVIIRNSAAGLPAPETLRRLNRAVVDYQHGRLSDDATTVLLEWVPEFPRDQLTA